MSYENPWKYQGKVFESEDIQDNFGFVYLITNKINSKQYIGRKYFWQFRTPKGKKRKVKSESDWKKYYGSCPELKEDIIKYGRENFVRVILSILFVNNVLTESLDNGEPAFYNNNILSRYFRKDYYESSSNEENVSNPS
jgi:hypothetical protein